MSTFKGRTALITGGGSGLGEAISKDLAREGANVVIVDIDMAAATRVADEIGATGGSAVPFRADTAVAEDNKSAVEFTLDTFGVLNYAVNNAGIGGGIAPVGEVDLDDWDNVIAINLSAVLYGMRYQVPAILAAGARSGAVLNMSSIHGEVAAPGSAAYTAAKHGVVGLTKNAAAEYGPHGLRINAIGPGYTRTPLLLSSPAEIQEGLEAKHALGRLGEPQEISNVAMFLLSEKASFVTGAFVLVDGGYTTV